MQLYFFIYFFLFPGSLCNYWMFCWIGRESYWWYWLLYIFVEKGFGKGIWKLVKWKCHLQFQWLYKKLQFYLDFTFTLYFEGFLDQDSDFLQDPNLPSGKVRTKDFATLKKKKFFSELQAPESKPYPPPPVAATAPTIATAAKPAKTSSTKPVKEWYV